jgi:hypothetical protein
VQGVRSLIVGGVVRRLGCAGFVLMCVAGGFVGSAQARGDACPNEAVRNGPSANLPDCRAYEQVTPADKRNSVEDLESVGWHAVAAEDGERLALTAAITYGPQPQENGSLSVFSRTSSGWTIASVKPAGSGAVVYAPEIFSPNLEQVGVRAYTESPPSPDSTYQVGVPGGPLATVAETSREDHSNFEGDVLLGGSSDVSHVVFASTDHTLLSATPTGTDKMAWDLYEWVNGQLQLVNVTGESSQAKLIGKCGATLGDKGVSGEAHVYETELAHNAVSTDGSKVFFSTPDPKAGNGSEAGCSNSEQQGPNARQLYMRESETVGGREQSRVIDVALPNAEVHLSPAEETEMQELPVFYQAATADGSKLFFFTKRVLTLDAVPGQGHLYEYDTGAGEGHRLTLIFSGIDEEEESGNPSVSVFPSQDGAIVYFYTNDEETLYRYEAGAGAAQLIASLQFPSYDEPPYTTPDGEFFVFESKGVAGEPRGAGHNELYRYDHAENSVMCVSCGPGSLAANGNALAPGPTSGRGNVFFASDASPAVIPMSADGNMVFFESTAALVPQVTREGPAHPKVPEEGVFNVYEWEADGAGTCTQSLGCTYLISQGNSQHSSKFLGASVDGSNVFFVTDAQLVPQDTDTLGDIYDARINGGFPPPTPSAACLGDTCLSVPVAPNDPAPASSSFSGPGNPTAVLTTVKPKVKPKAKRCPKGRVRKKSRCVGRKAARRPVRYDRGGSK